MRELLSPRAVARVLALAIAVTVPGAPGCVQPVTVRTVQTPGASFDRYQTFSFGSPEGPPRGFTISSRSEEVQQLLRPLVVAALLRKGYAASDKGDFIVTLGSGRRVATVREATPPEGDQSELESPHFDYQEVDGSVVVDAFDAASGLKVWHGSSRTEIPPRRVDQALLQRSVTMLFASFPARRLSAR
jgi:hypothetical protein